MYVVLNSTDPLAKQKEISLGDMHGRQWILFERHVHQLMYDRLQKAATAAQSILLDVQHVTTAEEALPLVADLQGLAVLTRTGAWRVAQDGFAMRPLRDESLQLVTFLAARPDESSRVVSEFVRGVVKKLQAVQRPRRAPPTFRLADSLSTTADLKARLLIASGVRGTCCDDLKVQGAASAAHRTLDNA